MFSYHDDQAIKMAIPDCQSIDARRCGDSLLVTLQIGDATFSQSFPWNQTKLVETIITHFQGLTNGQSAISEHEQTPPSGAGDPGSAEPTKESTPEQSADTGDSSAVESVTRPKPRT